MTQLIAQSPVFYGGRTYRKGEVFEAGYAHAKLLLLTRKVKVHEPQAEAQIIPEAGAAKPRRQYRRRDMSAES